MSDEKSTVYRRGDGEMIVTTGPKTCCFGSKDTAAKFIASYQQEVLALTARLAAAQVRNVCPECGLTPGAISTCVCEECVGELQERLAAAEALNKPRMSLHAEIARLQDRLVAAEEALQPFAKVAADIDPKLEDYMTHHYDHLVGHYRAAAKAAKGGRDE